MGLGYNILSNFRGFESDESETPRVTIFLKNFAGYNLSELGHVVFKMGFIKVHWESADKDFIFLAR